MLESGENYLETILLLQRENGAVRSIDVAQRLAVTKASVSRAMSILEKEEYLLFSQGGKLVLTEKGRLKAESILERHEVLTRFLITALGVSRETAALDACRFEHDISAETFQKVKEFLQKQA
ncbi:MAG: metal-dependent transcriptional regulator [Oscillospiraceae bacterium]|nr:metal-dependent transcriptional regulator [Oscillospiraceae bacterium]